MAWRRGWWIWALTGFVFWGGYPIQKISIRMTPMSGASNQWVGIGHPQVYARPTFPPSYFSCLSILIFWLGAHFHTEINRCTGRVTRLIPPTYLSARHCLTDTDIDLVHRCCYIVKSQSMQTGSAFSESYYTSWWTTLNTASFICDPFEINVYPVTLAYVNPSFSLIEQLISATLTTLAHVML